MELWDRLWRTEEIGALPSPNKTLNRKDRKGYAKNAKEFHFFSKLFFAPFALTLLPLRLNELLFAQRAGFFVCSGSLADHFPNHLQE